MRRAGEHDMQISFTAPVRREVNFGFRFLQLVGIYPLGLYYERGEARATLTSQKTLISITHAGLLDTFRHQVKGFL